MSDIGSQYTLYYSLPSPLQSSETGHEEKFDDIIDALSKAWLVIKDGWKPTHLIYDDAVLFSGDDFKEALRYVQPTDPRHGSSISEAVRKALPTLLTSQLAKTVKVAHEHFGAMVVYRDLLEDLYRAADQAIQRKDLGLLHQITGKLAFWYVPSEREVKQWGKDFLRAYRRDAGWLHDTKKALEKIVNAAEELEVEEGSSNAELRERILKAAEDGLVTHI